MPWTPTSSRVVEPDAEPDFDDLNQELQRTEWEIGYTPAKLAAAAVARPVISLFRAPRSQER